MIIVEKSKWLAIQVIDEKIRINQVVESEAVQWIIE